MLINHLKNKNTYEFILILISVLIPFTDYFSSQFTSIAIILLLVFWLIQFNKNEFIQKLKDNKILLLFVLVYFINVNGLFREGVEGVTEKILLKKLSLLLLPLIIGTSSELEYKQIKRIIIFFLISLLISTFFTYSNGITYLLNLQEDITNVAKAIIIHRPYFGLFCGFAILSLVYFLFNKQKLSTRIVYIISIIYLFVFMAIIYAKMAIIAVVLSITLLIFCYLFFKKKYTYITVILLFILAGLLFTYDTKPNIKNHITTILTGKEFSFDQYNILLVGSINTRYINWGCAYKVLAENNTWLYGTGPGLAQKKLQECYKLRNEWVYKSKMNAHNQYLEELLHNGIFGLLIFISSILVPIGIAVKRKDLLYFSFLIFFAICCITESILTKQIGIIFYAFFNSIFLFNPNRQTHPLSHT